MFTTYSSVVSYVGFVRLEWHQRNSLCAVTGEFAPYLVHETAAQK
uniref:Uncharacterized protein n=1 Tax=Bird gammacoronavirus AnasCN24 TaxID=3237959 RepID=A0AB39AEH3_9GAMC